MGDQNALFAQYEAEYCTSSTNVARKIQGLSIIAGGTLLTPSPPRPCTRWTPRSVVPAQNELLLRRLLRAEQRRAKGREVESDLKEADQTVRSLLSMLLTCGAVSLGVASAS